MSDDGEDVAKALRELEELGARTRSVSMSMATGLPLIGWGVAWIVSLGALDLLSGAPRVVVVTLAWTIGMALSWLPTRGAVRRGTEARMRWAWLIVLVGSPLLVSAAQPSSMTNVVLLLGALWGLAMCLYAVATGDRLLAFASGIGVVAAGVLAFFDGHPLLLWYGLLGGVALLALGLYRSFGGGRRG